MSIHPYPVASTHQVTIAFTLLLIWKWGRIFLRLAHLESPRRLGGPLRRLDGVPFMDAAEQASRLSLPQVTMEQHGSPRTAHPLVANILVISNRRICMPLRIAPTPEFGDVDTRFSVQTRCITTNGISQDSSPRVLDALGEPDESTAVLGLSSACVRRFLD